MKIIKDIYYYFAPYTDPKERAVALFFKDLTEHSSQAAVRTKLHELLQRDIATINLWSEYKYKGYDYLRKSHRKQLYENLAAIAKDFDDFKLRRADSSAKSSSDPKQQRLALLKAIAEYLSPTRGLYEYRASSSFGRLLKDPNKERLIGDCNQIVTLYIYIYSRYFDVSDLKIRLLPKHVALHYEGMDIETTNGTFQNYEAKSGARLLPIDEIVSVNLLDVSDEYLKTHEVDARDFLQASRFAFLLSHYRDIVKNNLEAAYTKLINNLMANHNYKDALKIANDSKDATLLSVVGNNGALHFMNNHDFAAAKKFAGFALKKDELLKVILNNEGVYYFNAKKYHDAIKSFEKLGNQKQINHCYEALFFTEQNKLGNTMTAETIKSHASTIKRMKTYAKKSGNKQLVDSADSLLKYL